MKGKLFLVATPIGNLSDITLRAIETLKNVDLIAAEDTRHTLKLLNHFEIKKPLISYYKETEKTKSEILIKKLMEGKNIALVSDAGTPGISDPGEEIIKNAIKEKIEIIPIPGACAAINALITSGMDTREFIFIGFLPVNKKEKKEKLEEIKDLNQTIILYEAPHKLLKTLETMMEIIGNRNITLAREITKVHEEFIRGAISEILEKYKDPKGEFVIIVDGNKNKKKENKFLELSLEQHYKLYEEKGLNKKEIIKQIAEDRGESKNDVYKHFLKK